MKKTNTREEIVTVYEDWNEREIYFIDSFGKKTILRKIPKEIPFPYVKHYLSKKEVELKMLEKEE